MTITIYKFHTANSARDFFSAPRRTLCVFCDCRANKVSHQKVPPGTPLDFSLFGEPHDQGLVFKWGSLVGIRQSSSGANATLPFTVADTAFVPNEFTGRITDDWASVPWCDNDFGNYGDPAVDHLTTVHDPTRGIGDICRYMGEVDGSQWRMPTAKEWDELYREQKPEGEARRIDNNSDWSDGLFAPLHGYAFGPHQSRITIISNTQVDNADPYINGTVFLPASGYRYPTAGAIYNIGSAGLYWSSTASTADRGYRIAFYSTTVVPQQTNPRTYGFSVRCIRE